MSLPPPCVQDAGTFIVQPRTHSPKMRASAAAFVASSSCTRANACWYCACGLCGCAEAAVVVALALLEKPLIQTVVQQVVMVVQEPQATE